MREPCDLFSRQMYLLGRCTRICQYQRSIANTGGIRASSLAARAVRSPIVLALWALVLAAMLGVVMPIATPELADAQAVPVRINEFVAQNDTGLEDNTSSTSDWIELYNTSNSTVNLNGWVIADGTELFAFDNSLSIGGGDYLVVFASGEPSRTTANELHLPFKLSSGGEALVLSSPTGTSTPSWPNGSEYPPQVSDVSFGVGSIGVLFYYGNPTPGASNAAVGLSGLVEPVTFSVPHGFYNSGQTVVLDSPTPNVTIRYTTNGSTPSASNGNSISAGQSIDVTSTTTLRAVGVRDGWITSQAETRSYFFTNDIVDQSAATPPDWPNDTEVNGQAFDYGMDPDVVNGNRAAVRNALEAIPTISITTDLDNLFGATNGIYVNASERGSEWERPASIELIDPSGAEPGFDINGGIRMRGGFSRSDANPKHSLRLFFGNDYEAPLDYALFGAEGTDEFEKVDLRTAQNYGWSWRYQEVATFIDELWSRDTQGAMGQPYSRSRPYHVYLNGRYWGLFMSQERVSGEFGESYFGGDEDDYDVVKRGAPGRTVEATNGTLDAFQSLYPLVSDGTVTNAEFAQLESQVNLKNLADYYLLHFFSGDYDGSPSWFFRDGDDRWTASNNWYAVRNRNGAGEAHKWTFFDHDSEHSLCAPQGPQVGVNVDNTTPWPMTVGPDYMSPAWLHQGLISHPAYRQIFQDSVNEHLIDPAGALTASASIARLDARAAEVSGAIDAESARWGDGPNSTNAVLGRADWNNALDIKRDCFVDRQSIVQAQLQADGLWPTSQPPTISPASGPIAFGSAIAISAAGQNGLLRYTTNGTDPRDVDGSPSASSQVYSGPIQMSASDLVVRARIDNNGSWSPMAEQSYTLSGPVGPVRMVLNEYNAVSSSKFLGGGTAGDIANGSDATFGRIVGNGGDWVEFVVLEDNLDIRGWTVQILSDVNGVQQQSAALTFSAAALFGDLRAGTIITISESLPDDVSYNPPAGDWHINLQANNAGAGGFFRAASQSDVIVDHRNTQVALFDQLGQPEALRTGEGTVGGLGIGSTEVFKLEGVPSSAITSNDGLYNEASTSTWGLANVWGAGAITQDLSSLRTNFGDVNCDGFVDVVDALFVAQYDVLARFDNGTCPLATPAKQLHADAGDVNFDGFTDVVDALFIAQCDAFVANVFCPEI